VSVNSENPTGTGTCTADAGALAPPTWKFALNACAASSLDAGTCSAPNACVPTPGSGFQFLCVWTGDVAALGDGGTPCPAGYPYKLDTDPAGTALHDDRSCASSCSCGPVAGASCPMTLALGMNEMCPGTGDDAGASACEPLHGADKITVVQNLNPGSCGVTSLPPTGLIAKTDPTRFCCTTPPQ
jgi:hypothetical protein